MTTGRTAMDSIKQLLQSHRHLWSASFVVLCAIISFASAWHRTSFGYWGLLVLIAYIALAIERKRFWPVWIGLFSLLLLCRIYAQVDLISPHMCTLLYLAAQSGALALSIPVPETRRADDHPTSGTINLAQSSQSESGSLQL